MANDILKGLKVAILVTDGFEQVELVEPRKALDEAAPRPASSRPRADVCAAGNSRIGATNCRSTCHSTKPSRRTFDALLLPGRRHQSRRAPDLAQRSRVR